jgi:2'-5' RNA ligase
MKVRFVLLFSETINKQIANLATVLAKESSYYFIVDNHRLFPHITLLKTVFNKKVLPDVLNFLRPKIFHLRPVSVKLNKIHHTKGWIDLNAEPYDEIFLLRENLKKIVTELNGKILPGNFAFRPHITLTRLRSRIKGAGLSEIRVPRGLSHHFQSGIVAAALYDGHGQVYQVLRRFKLS